MNIPNANDDSDFPVHRAGPPLPIRSKGTSHLKAKGTVPLKATSSSVLASQSSCKPCSSNSSAKCSSITAESKVKQYIERVKARDEQGRKKRLKPEQMLSLEDLYQVNVDEKSREKIISKTNKDEPAAELSVADVQERLRETMRIVKEKDELINKLRESCHDLAIKCADAENRVDELRFSYGRSLPVGKEAHQQQPKRLNIGTRASICGETSVRLPHETCAPRRCASVESLCMKDSGSARAAEGESNHHHPSIDECIDIPEKVSKQDAHTQVEPHGDAFRNEALSNQEVGHWEQLELEEDILQETCSNWLEKVQNWKTDSNFNLSQDSGGDRDSGFRSSAEMDGDSIRRQQRLISTKMQRKGEEKSGEKLLKVPPKCSTTQVPLLSSSSSTTITVPRRASCTAGSNGADGENLPGLSTQQQRQHFWPSFSTSQSYFHLNNFPNESLESDTTKAKSLFYELAEAERNKYECFQEGYSAKNSSHDRKIHGAKSLDVLYFPQTAHHRTKEELKSLIDSSFDPPEFILKSHLDCQHRSIDKRVKMLDPLLDDATQIALRVKQKSERLAKMLQDACTFD